MKKLFILMFVFVSFSLSAQIGSGAATSFNYGIKLPNATKSDTLSAQTRIPILKDIDNNLMNIYVPLEDLGAYVSGILWGNIEGNLPDQADLQAALDSKATKVGTPVNNEIGIWTGDPTLKGDPNLTWSGTQMLMQNTESVISPAIQIGTNGRDVSTWGQGVTTAMTHTSIDFNAFADMSLINLALDEDKGYGSFDASVKVEGTFPLNHLYGYQSRVDYGALGTMPATVGNGIAGFYSNNRVSAGTVPNAYGLIYHDIGGAGTVNNQYGVYIKPLAKGTVSNYGVYSDNNNYLKSADIDQLVIDGGFAGVTVREGSYVVFGDNNEVDFGFGGTGDMYVNLIDADNLFVRDDITTRFTFNRLSGNFTATGSVTGNSFATPTGTSSQFLKADGSIDSNSYLLSSSYTAADVLAKLLTVDGSGSELDADLLRGVHWGNVNTNISTTGRLISLNTIVRDNNSGVTVISQNGGSGGGQGIIFRPVSDVSVSGQLFIDYNGTATYSGNLTANSFIKSGGTNQQALLADGTVKTVPKVYTALVSQSGTSAPTATVLENTLGGTVVWTRTTTGSYTASLSSAFPENKTFVLTTKGTGNESVMGFNRANNNDIQFFAVNFSGASVDGIVKTSVKIEVYP